MEKLVLRSSVKKYLQENDMTMPTLLVLDNASVHPPKIKNDIIKESNFIKVLSTIPHNSYPVAYVSATYFLYQEALNNT